jgi:hypothetical protein
MLCFDLERVIASEALAHTGIKCLKGIGSANQAPPEKKLGSGSTQHNSPSYRSQSSLQACDLLRSLSQVAPRGTSPQNLGAPALATPTYTGAARPSPYFYDHLSIVSDGFNISIVYTV